ncbi:hypothetical protein [Desulfurivibrio alkaliphilus]|uniref:Antitoxin SocA-like Panacea domain-containing protein n=1 Tax=Desulfurivibrio alkaliphilus (strain DSM 19089 / UNIQEM U267 / AHT2) TaxID=589865 RepID=D6Z673_DESAT|nr:hypothetical protein [Desulfurivibrio alkaliphilus]ADH86838.1 conserved hypothetical protein [Desulfurivibrio alkaliphilus AHT 2]
MNKARVQELIKFILAEAWQDEDYKNRELGPIQLIKYIYLADLYYAAKNEGRCFTDIDWQFYKLGPWNLELHKELPNAAKAIGANLRIFESRYTDEGKNWSLPDDHPDYKSASKPIPPYILFRLRADIRKYGAATYDLLHYVYLTPPMTNAAPGQLLDFNYAYFAEQCSPRQSPSTPRTALTAREKKKKKDRLEKIKTIMAAMREEKRKSRIKPVPPRYDEVFYNGVAELDALAGEEIPNSEGTLSISKEIWKSNWRKDADLP